MNISKLKLLVLDHQNHEFKEDLENSLMPSDYVNISD